MYAIHKAKCIVQHIIKVRASATAHSLMQFLPFKLVEDFFFQAKKAVPNNTNLLQSIRDTKYILCIYTHEKIKHFKHDAWFDSRIYALSLENPDRMLR